MSNQYHLHQKGETTGPYEASQLKAMWKSGGVTADAQICPVGASEWQPVASIIKPDSLKAEGKLTVIGIVGTALFSLMAIPALLIGQFLVSIPLMLLAAMCFFKARRA